MLVAFVVFTKPICCLLHLFSVDILLIQNSALNFLKFNGGGFHRPVWAICFKLSYPRSACLDICEHSGRSGIWNGTNAPRSPRKCGLSLPKIVTA